MPGPLSSVRDDLAAPTRWPSLDGVRGLALVGVIAFHLYRLTVYGSGLRDVRPSPAWAWPLGAGKFTIDVFFVLSGLLIMQSWLALRRRHPNGRAFATFWVKRFRRVLPVWWVSLIVLVPLLAPHLLGTAEGWWKLGMLATVQQYVIPGLPAEVNVVSWSLTTEIHFYLAVPIVAWLIDRVGGTTVLLGSVALSLAWWSGWLVESPTSLLPGRLDQFVAGALAGTAIVAHDQGRITPVVDIVHRRAFLPLAVGAIAFFSLYEGAWFGRPHLQGPVTEVAHPAVGLLAAGLLVRHLTRGAPSVLHARVPRALGLVSYSAYLWHYPLLIFLFSTTDLMGAAADNPLSSLAMVTAALIAIVGIAVVSYAAFERPFLHARNRRREPIERLVPAA